MVIFWGPARNSSHAVSISNLQYPRDELLVVLQLLIIMFGYRGYRELRDNKIIRK